MTPTWRAKVCDLLEQGEMHPWAPATAKTFLMVVIATTVAAAALETLVPPAGRTGGIFALIEWTAVTIMTLEYALRLWIAPENEPGTGSGPWRARLRFAVSPLGVIDLVAILPFFFNLVAPIPPDWLRVLRLLRLLKLARYTPALSVFAAVIRHERRLLLATLWVIVMLLVLESAVMFALERDAQPGVFASIPHAMWWAIVTIATVGYGDMVPVTPLGKVFGGMLMVLGIAIFAVPAGILAGGFAAELRKRDLVVTWQTVAKVPLFAGLDATRIADIARLLKRQVVPARFAVVRRGEPAEAMFFIMAGQVEVDVPPQPIRLGAGHFFGEMALLQNTVRNATVTALTECHLLSLEVADFHRLLDAHPTLRASINQVAQQRQSESVAVAPAAPGHDSGRG